MDRFGVCCPLCSSVFEDDAGYVAHLADRHDLVDDEGTATTLEQAVVSSDGWAAVVAVAPPGDPAPAPAAPEPARSKVPVPDFDALGSDRVFDPDADDHRWKTAVVGLTGVAVLVLLLLGDLLT